MYDYWHNFLDKYATANCSEHQFLQILPYDTAPPPPSPQPFPPRVIVVNCLCFFLSLGLENIELWAKFVLGCLPLSVLIGHSRQFMGLGDPCKWEFLWGRDAVTLIQSPRLSHISQPLPELSNLLGAEI